jgi:hypothetical protein
MEVFGLRRRILHHIHRGKLPDSGDGGLIERPRPEVAPSRALVERHRPGTFPADPIRRTIILRDNSGKTVGQLEHLRDAQGNTTDTVTS